jgi:hypothetical protein
VLIDCNTDGDGRLDEDAQFDVDVYAYAIGAIDAAADRLARVMRESSESGGLRNAAQAALDWIEAQPHPRMLGAFDTAEQLRAALAEQEDVPEVCFGKSVEESRMTFQTPQPSMPDEPVALLHTGAMFGNERDEYEFEVNGHERLERFCDQHPDQKILLFAHPPRREWRGLTDEEIKDLAYDGRLVLDLARAIEEALRRKNHD